MENIILSLENIKDITKQLNELSKDKKYWLGITSGKTNSTNEEGFDIFRGVGTFERIVYLEFSVGDYYIQITHLSAKESFVVIPQESYIRLGAEITTDGSDILSFENDPHIGKNGGTQIYMEWTVARNEKFKPALV